MNPIEALRHVARLTVVTICGAPHWRLWVVGIARAVTPPSSAASLRDNQAVRP